MSEIISLTLESEREWLAEQASKMTSIVEIGAFHGGTTDIFLKNCKGPVWVVDPWQIITENFVRFAENMQDREGLIIMKMPSGVAYRYFPENSIDMVFIDGNHDYMAVKADINHWRPIARTLFCGHDYGHPTHPGVKHAVDKLIKGAQITDMIWYEWIR